MRKQDARVARALGWTTREIPVGGGSITYWNQPDGRPSFWGVDVLGVLPPFTTDPVAARQVEDEIERRGLWERYTKALLEIINPDAQLFSSALEHGGDPRALDIPSTLWGLIRATPAQRCEAALKVLEAP